MNTYYLTMANTLNTNQIKGILNAFKDFEITPFQFFHGLLGTKIFEDHPTTLSLSDDGDAILNLFKSSNGTSALTTRWVYRVAKETYRTQMHELTKKENGFHFLASKTTEDQLTWSTIEALSTQMQNCAPDLWQLVAELLMADPTANLMREQRALKKARAGKLVNEPNDGDITMSDAAAEDDDREFLDSNDIPLVEEGDDAPDDLQEHVAKQFGALIMIVSLLSS